MQHTKRLATGLAAGAIAALVPDTLADAARTGGQPGSVGAPGPASITKSLNITPHDLRLIEAGLAIVVLLAVVLVLRIRRRRRAEKTADPRPETHAFPTTNEAWRGSGMVEESTQRLPAFQAGEVVAPTMGPGWHPIQGDRLKLGYWDGVRWTAHLEWDGRQWVDPKAVNV